MTSKLVHDYGVLGLVECPGDMLNKETQYLLVLLGRHTRSSSVICGVPDNRFHIWLFNIDMLASEYCHVCQGVVGWAIFDRHWSLATIFSTTFGIFVKRDLKEGRYVWLQRCLCKAWNRDDVTAFCCAACQCPQHSVTGDSIRLDCAESFKLLQNWCNY